MDMNTEMRVKKRDGTLKTIEFDKILRRIKTLGNYDAKATLTINYTALAMKTIDQIYDGISTTKIDEVSAEQCMAMSSLHPDYSTLAGRIVVSNHQKNTKTSFSEVMTDLYNFKDKHGKQSPLVSDELYKLVQERGAELDAMCDYSRDYLIDYFGFKTLERSYLMKISGKTVERPQHMWLRVAIGIHNQNIADIKETYDYMSRKYMTHATPTLFNAGTPHPQLSSCFLQAMESDSIDGIYNTLKDCALISKWAGGIGLHIHNVRASGSHIRGTNGSSNGIVPMLKVFNNTAKYVDQCVHPETKIYTTNGTIDIQSCIANHTSIYNLTGGTEIIQNVLEHEYEGEFLHITSETGDVLRITPQHPVYAVRSGMDVPEWIDAGELRVNDYIVHSVPTWSQDISTLSAMDCYMCGVGATYGFPLRPPSLTDYIQSRELADEVAQYLDEKLIQWREPDEGRVGKGTVGSLHSPFRRSDFFDDAGRKRIQARWMNLPIEKSKHILRGLYRKCEQTDDVLTFHTEYGEDVRMLCLRLGTIVRVQKDKVIIPRTRKICELLGEEYQGFVAPAPYLKAVITNIQTTEYRGLLYDFQMKDEHNYMLTSGLVHNGGGKRNGSFAIYLEPWHADIELFLQMRKNHGDEELKARDLFYAIWMPDLFMERVKTSGKWTLMCPDECPGLADVYGDEFVALYEKYEAEGKGRKTVEARDIWFQILDAQMETGTPYLLFKDACNKKSNQKNLGTIKSSNLCVAPETLVLTDKGHVEIQTMEGQTVSVWNGEEFSDVEIVKTGIDQDLITVHTDNGSNLTCTPYHKFYIQDDAGDVKMVEAKDLKSGDKLIQCKYPVIDGTETPDVVNNFVVKITDEGRKDDTYCFTEPKRHMGVFNGILTGQCSEIVQYSDANETAVCNLASIALPTFVSADGIMDYDELHKVAKILTSNLNKVIDINYYPIEKTRTSNLKHRPIGIGVQGFSCVFMKMNVPFDSDIARDTNKKIFETIYHAALERSCELAERDGAYASFAGSPASRGELQFDLWGVNPGTDRYNWPELKQRIIKHGIRNSLLLAPMPTASTSQILGYNECIEPITSNIYNRRTIAGEFMMTNKYLMNDLLSMGLWNEKIKNNIIANNGSVQHIEAIPKEVRDKYKTVWEMSMKCLIDMSADRGAFICQSQSLNLWLEEPNYNTLTSMHFYSWSKGLKTGIYYLRRRARHQAQQFTIEPTQAECVMCGS